MIELKACGTLELADFKRLEVTPDGAVSAVCTARRGTEETEVVYALPLDGSSFVAQALASAQSKAAETLCTVEAKTVTEPVKEG